MVAGVEDGALLAAQQRLDQLLDDGRLLVDDGQVQRPAGTLPVRPVRPDQNQYRCGGTHVSPLASWMPHRCLCSASRTRASPVLQYCSRAAAVCRALCDTWLLREAAGRHEPGQNQNHGTEPEPATFWCCTLTDPKQLLLHSRAGRTLTLLGGGA